MNKLLLILLLALIVHVVSAQNANNTISGKYQNVPFEEFVVSVEKSTSFRFQFKHEWTKDLKVNVSGSDLNLASILTDIFRQTNLKFYIENKLIIIYPGKEMVLTLPDYVAVVDSQQTIVKDTTMGLTEFQQNYIEGKKEVKLEVVKVGNTRSFSAGKKSTVRGKITDKASGEPIIGATIFIEELGIGAATDLDGYFNIVLEQGEYLVDVRSVSMKEKIFYLEVYAAGEISIAMEKEVISLSEVQVVANRNDNVAGMQMGYERITSKSMKEIPAVMGEKDILKVAQMLPGVQSAGEGSAGLHVRGGTADQNLFYINKIPIYNTSHLFGFFSAFNSDIVSSFSLYKSNIPAKFGGRLSSVFDVATRRGNRKEFSGQGGISPITGHFALEGPVKKDKSSFVLSYRGTYSDWLLKQVDDVNINESDASFYDLSAAFNTDINKSNSLRFFGYGSKDRFSLATTDDYDYSNAGGAVNWKHLFSTSLNGDFAAVYSQYNFNHNSKSNPSEAYRHEYQLGHTELKADFLYLTNNNHRISFGATGIFYNHERGDILPYGEESTRIPVVLGKEKGVEAAIYLSDEFSISEKLSVLAGLRYSMFSLLGPMEINSYFPNSPIDENNIQDTKTFEKGELVKWYSGLEPRVAFNYLLGANNSMKASYNRGRQYIFMLSNTVAISPSDMWKLADYHLSPPVSDQISLGYYHNFPGLGLETSAEIYQKWTNDIVEYKDGVDFISPMPTEMLLLQGKQDSYGLELMVKKNTGKLTGMFSYTYSNSEVQVKSDLPSEQINYGNAYPSNYDRPHSLNFVSTYRTNMRISFSSIVEYSSGRPVTYPITSYYTNGQEILHYSGRNEYRIPDYFRIDFSINLEGNLKKEKIIHSYWMLNVYNLTGRKNAYSVYYEAKEGKMQGYKMSIFGQPIITLSWNFKFGNYANE